jgi:hypothetical protein
MSKVTRILNAFEQGDPHAAEQLLPLVFDELLTGSTFCAGSEVDLLGRRSVRWQAALDPQSSPVLRNPGPWA